MAIPFRVMRTSTSVHLLHGAILLLIPLVGCAAQSKDQPSTPTPSPSAQPAQTTQRPADTALPPAAPPQLTPEVARREGAEQAPPAGKVQGESGLEAAESMLRELAASGGQMTEQQRQALAEMIRAAVNAGLQAEAQKAQPLARPATGGEQRVTPAAPPTPPQTQPATAPAGKGCGATETGPPVDLTPPPPDSPQPKFVCKQTKVTVDSVWQGTQVQFEFEVANEGEGPLAIRLKGG